MIQLRCSSLLLYPFSILFLLLLNSNCKTSGSYSPRSNERVDLNSVILQPVDDENSVELKLDKSGNSFIDLEIITNNSGISLLQMIQNGEIAAADIVLQDSTGQEVVRQSLSGISELLKSNSRLKQKILISSLIKDGYYSAHLEFLYIDPIIQELCLDSGVDCPRLKAEILTDMKKNNVLKQDGCTSAAACQSQIKSTISSLNAGQDTYPYKSVTFYGNSLQYKEWNLVSKSNFFLIRVKAEVKAKKFDDSEIKEAPARTPEKKIETLKEQNIFRKKKGF
ncbi:MAG: hypothetical protein GW938_01965 [Leptospira sp.]|nr:hypothetical protein [Leptospira sp.]